MSLSYSLSVAVNGLLVVAPCWPCCGSAGCSTLPSELGVIAGGGSGLNGCGVWLYDGPATKAGVAPAIGVKVQVGAGADVPTFSGCWVAAGANIGAGAAATTGAAGAGAGLKGVIFGGKLWGGGAAAAAAGTKVGTGAGEGARTGASTARDGLNGWYCIEDCEYCCCDSVEDAWNCCVEEKDEYIWVGAVICLVKVDEDEETVGGGRYDRYTWHTGGSSAARAPNDPNAFGVDHSRSIAMASADGRGEVLRARVTSDMLAGLGFRTLLLPGGAGGNLGASVATDWNSVPIGGVGIVSGWGFKRETALIGLVPSVTVGTVGVCVRCDRRNGGSLGKLILCSMRIVASVVRRVSVTIVDSVVGPCSFASLAYSCRALNPPPSPSSASSERGCPGVGGCANEREIWRICGGELCDEVADKYYWAGEEGEGTILQDTVI
uniref:Uncharacterized protein n=1 Tax=Anopheles merus TaxID=30066 RepID=A0A182UNH2_ANOME